MMLPPTTTMDKLTQKNKAPVILKEPMEFDVLCGKDKTYSRHTGNQTFRSLIESWLDTYTSTTSKKKKMTITKEIVSAMHNKYHARFIKPIAGGRWEEISDKLARDKVSHALRFAASQQKANYNKKSKARASLNIAYTAEDAAAATIMPPLPVTPIQSSRSVVFVGNGNGDDEEFALNNNNNDDSAGVVDERLQMLFARQQRILDDMKSQEDEEEEDNNEQQNEERISAYAHHGKEDVRDDANTSTTTRVVMEGRNSFNNIPSSSSSKRSSFGRSRMEESCMGASCSVDVGEPLPLLRSSFRSEELQFLLDDPLVTSSNNSGSFNGEDWKAFTPL